VNTDPFGWLFSRAPKNAGESIAQERQEDHPRPGALEQAIIDAIELEG
jgi:hypothetical protein